MAYSPEYPQTADQAQAWLDSTESISPPDLPKIDTEDTIFVSAKPPVLDLLHSPHDQERLLAVLATRDTDPGKIALTLIENNGALPLSTIEEITGISSDKIYQVSKKFPGHIKVDKDVAIADALLPQLSKEGVIFSPKLAKAG